MALAGAADALMLKASGGVAGFVGKEVIHVSLSLLWGDVSGLDHLGRTLGWDQRLIVRSRGQWRGRAGRPARPLFVAQKKMGRDCSRPDADQRKRLA